eukprot:gnl/TRDRNA2_/TRDRNA2_87857_c0_seq1.p1 gnl/TRDRNA2_/TRDRNA2_87857_c0~~gnl/TRDRNA2_/TRDRNA2_87857_c0_seq1.p1  ORF type:complete len:194 (+),score=26.81 gnl/TRDRNA2_/TRDRNA2_87857_c0_seq1:131-712(+)
MFIKWACRIGIGSCVLVIVAGKRATVSNTADVEEKNDARAAATAGSTTDEKILVEAHAHGHFIVDKRQGVSNQCNANDIAMLQEVKKDGRQQAFFEFLANCGAKSYSWTMAWRPDTFKDCMGENDDLRMKTLTWSCKDCFSESGKYGLMNCKIPCMSKWCSQSCLNCVKPFQDEFDRCTGKHHDELLGLATMC